LRAAFLPLSRNGVAILAAALINVMAMWRRRPKSPAAERAREEAVRENYRRGG